MAYCASGPSRRWRSGASSAPRCHSRLASSMYSEPVTDPFHTRVRASGAPAVRGHEAGSAQRGESSAALMVFNWSSAPIDNLRGTQPVGPPPRPVSNSCGCACPRQVRGKISGQNLPSQVSPTKKPRICGAFLSRIVLDWDSPRGDDRSAGAPGPHVRAAWA